MLFVGQVGRYVLCVFNVASVVMALCLINIGSRLRIVHHSPPPLVVDSSESGDGAGAEGAMPTVPGVLDWRTVSLCAIILGLVVCFISSIGVFASAFASPFVMNIYAYFLSLLTGAVLLAAVSSSVWLPLALEQMRHHFGVWVTVYGRYSAVARYAVEWVQTSAQCCGDRTPLDWHRHIHWTSTNNGSGTASNLTTTTTTIMDEYHLPGSCCANAPAPVDWSTWWDWAMAHSGPIPELVITAALPPRCSEWHLDHMNGCFGQVKRHSLTLIIQVTFVFVLVLLAQLLTLAYCVERNLLLGRSKRVNLSYRLHLANCAKAKLISPSPLTSDPVNNMAVEEKSLLKKK